MSIIITPSLISTLVFATSMSPFHVLNELRAQATEVTTAMGLAKAAVEECYFDTRNLTKCNSGAKADPAQGQSKWQIPLSEYTETPYVAGVMVQNGVITGIFKKRRDPNDTCTIVVVPVPYTSPLETEVIDWKLSKDKSTCDDIDLI